MLAEVELERNIHMWKRPAVQIEAVLQGIDDLLLVCAGDNEAAKAKPGVALHLKRTSEKQHGRPVTLKMVAHDLSCRCLPVP